MNVYRYLDKTRPMHHQWSCLIPHIDQGSMKMFLQALHHDMHMVMHLISWLIYTAISSMFLFLVLDSSWWPSLWYMTTFLFIYMSVSSRTNVDHNIHDYRRGFGTTGDGITHSRSSRYDMISPKRYAPY